MPLNFTAVPLVPSDYTELALGVICRLHCPFWTKQLHNTVLAHSSLCVRAFAGPVPSASSGAQKRGETCARRRCGRWRSAEAQRQRVGRSGRAGACPQRPSGAAQATSATAAWLCITQCFHVFSPAGPSLARLLNSGRPCLASSPRGRGSRWGAEVMLLPPAAL